MSIQILYTSQHECVTNTMSSEDIANLSIEGIILEKRLRDNINKRPNEQPKPTGTGSTIDYSDMSYPIYEERYCFTGSSSYEEEPGDIEIIKRRFEGRVYKTNGQWYLKGKRREIASTTVYGHRIENDGTDYVITSDRPVSLHKTEITFPIPYGITNPYQYMPKDVFNRDSELRFMFHCKRLEKEKSENRYKLGLVQEQVEKFIFELPNDFKETLARRVSELANPSTDLLVSQMGLAHEVLNTRHWDKYELGAISHFFDGYNSHLQHMHNVLYDLLKEEEHLIQQTSKVYMMDEWYNDYLEQHPVVEELTDIKHPLEDVSGIGYINQIEHGDYVKHYHVFMINAIALRETSKRDEIFERVMMELNSVGGVTSVSKPVEVEEKKEVPNAIYQYAEEFESRYDDCEGPPE